MIDQELLNACVVNSWSIVPRMMLIDSMIESGCEEVKAMEVFEPPTASQHLPSIYNISFGRGRGRGYGNGDGIGSSNVIDGDGNGSGIGNGSGNGNVGYGFGNGRVSDFNVGNGIGRGCGYGIRNKNGYRDITND